MAGDYGAYEEALSAGSSLAWERQWEQAIEAYRRALAEFPNDAAALSGLGMALAEVGRLEEALSAYQEAARADREDPTQLEHAAQILERLARSQEASQAYLEAAERYSRRQAPTLAVERWQDAVRADPACVTAHVRLLQVYLSERKEREALGEYLALADIYEAEGKNERALELCRYALQLDPHDPNVLSMMDRLRYGERPPGRAPGTGPLDPSVLDEERRGSPVEAARQKALGVLAEAVFDERPPQTGPLILRPLSKREVDGLLSKALDAQTKGDVEEAITYYEEVLRGGVIQPAIDFNLGLLYQQHLRFDEAIGQFQKSLGSADYRLGSYFALGECCRALGRIDEALGHFVEGLRVLDLAMVRQDQVDGLARVYDKLARTYTVQGGRGQAVEFVNVLISFMNEPDWEDRLAQARACLDALTPEGPVLALAEVFAVPDSARVLESIALAQDYLRRDLTNAALDELDRAVTLAPYFLPVHLQMAEALVGMGQADGAVAKFLAIADVYQVRGDSSQAAVAYERALGLAPTNAMARANLIDLLVGHGEVDRALEQTMLLAAVYYQMAQWDRAREAYGAALELAPKGSPERQWTLRILHNIGDIDVQRLDWRQAVSVYRRICELSPGDEKARLTLVDYFHRFGRPEQAIVELDGLLRFLREAGATERVIAVLQDLVQERADDIPLRTRLAQAFLDARDVEQALVHLDTLGDLQLQAGRTEEAVGTIEMILRLNPPHAEPYRKLLAELTSGQANR